MTFMLLSESLDLEQIHFGKRVQNSKDEDMEVYTFEWMTSVSIRDCMGACKSTKACEYINFEVRSHKCALIRANDSKYVVKVSDKPGFIFGNKSEWSAVSASLFYIIIRHFINLTHDVFSFKSIGKEHRELPRWNITEQMLRNRRIVKLKIFD